MNWEPVELIVVHFRKGICSLGKKVRGRLCHKEPLHTYAHTHTIRSSSYIPMFSLFRHRPTYPEADVTASSFSPSEPLTWAQLDLFVKSGVMSFSSRRACYKCGNVGHYAGWWSSTKICSAALTIFRGLRLFGAALL